MGCRGEEVQGLSMATKKPRVAARGLVFNMRVLPDLFFERLADAEIDDSVAFDGLAFGLIAKRNYFFVIYLANIEGAETRDDHFFTFF